MKDKKTILEWRALAKQLASLREDEKVKLYIKALDAENKLSRVSIFDLNNMGLYEAPEFTPTVNRISQLFVQKSVPFLHYGNEYNEYMLLNEGLEFSFGNWKVLIEEVQRLSGDYGDINLKVILKAEGQSPNHVFEETSVRYFEISGKEDSYASPCFTSVREVKPTDKTVRVWE
jgi:hypothetical protein